ncbi:hypothetical protein ACFL0V_04360 [Nanoarchaeota archaeon]
MKYQVIESRLKTNRSADYLWNKMNSPKKIVQLEGFGPDAKITKISTNTHSIQDKKYHVLVNFIPKKAVNMTFVGKMNFPLAWFEIIGTKNCTITHGEYKWKNKKFNPTSWNKEVKWIKTHFLEELREIAR